MQLLRIVSLLPSATEILFAIGAGDDVVAVTHECDYPPEAKTRPVVTSALPLAPGEGTRAEQIDRHVRANVHGGSGLYALDADAVERLAPDLIVTQELCAVCAVSYEIVSDAVRRMSGDPRIVSLEPASIADIYQTIRMLGELTGRADAAEQVVESLRERETRLRERTAAFPRPRTLLLEWTQPPFGPGHWTPELVSLAGGEPLLGAPGANAPTLAWEAIDAADPDAVVVAPCGFDLEATHAAIADLETHPVWSGLRAVREGRVYPIDGNAYVSRPGPRIIESAELIASALHETLAESA